MTLKTSEKVFHNFKLYFLLPMFKNMLYIRHRIHKFYLCLSIHDCLEARRNFQDALFCKLRVSIYIRLIVFLCQYNLLGRGSWYHQGSLRTRKALADLGTGHVHPRIF